MTQPQSKTSSPDALTEIYVCPACLARLECQPCGEETERLVCKECSEEYPVRDQLPILVPSWVDQRFPLKRVREVYERAYTYADTLGTKFDPEYSEVTKTLLLEMCMDAPNDRMLDVGTGDGDLWQFAPVSKGWYGIDISEVGVRRAMTRFPRLHGAVALSEYLPYPDEYFGAVLAVDTIEHTFDITQTLTSIRRVLAKGGIFAFSVPTPNSLRRWGYNRLLRSTPSLHLVIRLLKTVVHRAWLFGNPCFQPIDRDISLDGWCESVQQSGFTIIAVREWPVAPFKPIVYLISARGGL